ncbi:MAG: FAD-dependent oxidoreductase, partial [Phycisphaerales bacterium]|nr:FAD-dependent oxidoreductase [Phycisphaerales bacterium]
MSPLPPVIVVGAGMSGLACARTLAARGIPVTVLESTDRVGGRLGSDHTEDIWCDRGFQVSMSNYEVLESLVPRDVVPRHSFISGAVVWTGRHRIRVIDPKKSPLSAWQPLLKGLVGLRDLRAAQRCRRWARSTISGTTRQGTANDVIRQAGFRNRFVETFLRPF